MPLFKHGSHGLKQTLTESHSENKGTGFFSLSVEEGLLNFEMREIINGNEIA